MYGGGPLLSPLLILLLFIIICSSTKKIGDGWWRIDGSIIRSKNSFIVVHFVLHFESKVIQKNMLYVNLPVDAALTLTHKQWDFFSLGNCSINVISIIRQDLTSELHQQQAAK